MIFEKKNGSCSGNTDGHYHYSSLYHLNKTSQTGDKFVLPEKNSSLSLFFAGGHGILQLTKVIDILKK